MSHDLNHLCLESNPKFDNVSDDLKVYSDVFEDVPYTMYGRCRRFSKLLVGPKIFIYDVSRIYSKIFLYNARKLPNRFEAFRRSSEYSEFGRWF